MVICHGQSHSDARVRIATQYVILCGISTGRKKSTDAHRKRPVAARAAGAVNLSLSFKIAMSVGFSANIANFRVKRSYDLKVVAKYGLSYGL